MPVVIGELERAAHDIGEKELQRARAQVRAGLLMTLESPAARAGQIAQGGGPSHWRGARLLRSARG